MYVNCLENDFPSWYEEYTFAVDVFLHKSQVILVIEMFHMVLLVVTVSDSIILDTISVSQIIKQWFFWHVYSGLYHNTCCGTCLLYQRNSDPANVQSSSYSCCIGWDVSLFSKFYFIADVCNRMRNMQHHIQPTSFLFSYVLITLCIPL